MCSPETHANKFVSVTRRYEGKVFPNPNSVRGRVLGALLRGEHLTHLGCQQRFGSSRLSGHIHIIKRKYGWSIDVTPAVVSTSDADRKATIGTYFLRAEVIEQAGEVGKKYSTETLRIECERRAA